MKQQTYKKANALTEKLPRLHAGAILPTAHERRVSTTD